MAKIPSQRGPGQSGGDSSHRESRVTAVVVSIIDKAAKKGCAVLILATLGVGTILGGSGLYGAYSLVSLAVR